MRLRIADGEYRNSFSQEIDIPEFAYSPTDQCLVFTLGGQDGFYPSNYKPKIAIERIIFNGDYILLIVNGKQNGKLLTEELTERSDYYARTHSNVHM